MCIRDRSRTARMNASVSTARLFSALESRKRSFVITPSSMVPVSYTHLLRFDYTLDETYKARFARFSFRVWPNAYCDELEVWGTKRVDNDSVPLAESGIEPRPLDVGSYAERDTYLGGANDIVLMPNYSADEDVYKRQLPYRPESVPHVKMEPRS